MDLQDLIYLAQEYNGEVHISLNDNEETIVQVTFDDGKPGLTRTLDKAGNVNIDQDDFELIYGDLEQKGGGLSEQEILARVEELAASIGTTVVKELDFNSADGQAKDILSVILDIADQQYGYESDEVRVFLLGTGIIVTDKQGNNIQEPKEDGQEPEGKSQEKIHSVEAPSSEESKKLFEALKGSEVSEQEELKINNMEDFFECKLKLMNEEISIEDVDFSQMYKLPADCFLSEDVEDFIANVVQAVEKEVRLPYSYLKSTLEALKTALEAELLYSSSSQLNREAFYENLLNARLLVDLDRKKDVEKTSYAQEIVRKYDTNNPIAIMLRLFSEDVAKDITVLTASIFVDRLCSESEGFTDTSTIQEIFLSSTDGLCMKLIGIVQEFILEVAESVNHPLASNYISEEQFSEAADLIQKKRHRSLEEQTEDEAGEQVEDLLRGLQKKEEENQVEERSPYSELMDVTAKNHKEAIVNARGRKEESISPEILQEFFDEAKEDANDIREGSTYSLKEELKVEYQITAQIYQGVLQELEDPSTMSLLDVVYATYLHELLKEIFHFATEKTTISSVDEKKQDIEDTWDVFDKIKELLEDKEWRKTKDFLESEMFSLEYLFTDAREPHESVKSDLLFEIKNYTLNDVFEVVKSMYLRQEEDDFYEGFKDVTPTRATPWTPAPEDVTPEQLELSPFVEVEEDIGFPEVEDTAEEENNDSSNLREKAIVQAYQQGATSKYIVDTFGVSSYGKLYSILLRNDVPFRTESSKMEEKIKHITQDPEKVKNVIDDYYKGLKVQDIFDKYDLYKHGLYYLLDKYNVPRRHKS